MNNNENALVDFSLYISAEKGLAKNTIEAYMRDVGYFLLHLGRKDISAIDVDDIVGFFSSIRSRGYATATVSRIFMSLKVFFKYLAREDFVERNFLATFENPKILQSIPEVLSITEVENMISIVDNDSLLGLRDKAILETLYGCGLRVSELVTLTLGDVDDKRVVVRGKGSKDRIVPIGGKALEAIFTYLNNRKYGKSRGDKLFLNNRGKALSRVSVWKIVKKYSTKANVTKNVFPHTLRHSFATHLLDGNADLRVIQELLGHETISSTDRYTHVSKKKITEKFQQSHRRY